MATWTETTLVQIADDYDREMADAGSALSSRFGHYLREHLGDIFEDERTDPVIFSRWVWSVATGPIMSPGYVRVRPDLSVTIERSYDDGHLYAVVGVPLKHHHLAQESRPPYDVGDWEREQNWVGEFPPLGAPFDRPERCRTTVLTTAELRVPASDWELHQPGDWTVEELLINDAKQAAALLVDQINDRVGPKVAALLGAPGGSW